MLESANAVSLPFAFLYTITSPVAELPKFATARSPDFASTEHP
jgi:hypothetical protein